MAYSYVAYTGNGSTTQFAITFPYVSQAHIKVYVNFVDTAYTYANSTTVQVATAPTNGHRVEVRRVTPINSVLVDYTDGATLVAADLDTTALQNLYLEQELDDNQKRAIYVDDATGLMTANGQRITNVANPTAAQDAATKTYVDTADALKVAKAGDSMTGALAMGTNKITGMGDPTNAQDAATKTYVDTADALKVAKAGDTMSGALAMGTNKITGLGTPTANADATTKVYVDTVDALKVAKAGDTMSGALAMGTNKITGMGDPTSAQDAATKTYVDTADALKVAKAGDTMSGALAMSTNKITGLGTPTANTDAATKAYVDTADALKVAKAGDSMTGALAMGTNKITGMGDPISAQDAATKTYVDTADALKVAKAGDSMTGALAMGTNKVTGLGTPTASTDAASKGYVDGLIAAASIADADYGDITVSGGGTVWTVDAGAITSAKILDGTIVDADINASAAIDYSKLATLASGNIVLGSNANVATSTAVTGDVTISNTGVTTIATGVIVNADINASAAIADTKLDTIATALKVSNSATTAASVNTASAIVARDASGNFTAGTITAALTGTASNNLPLAGGTLTGNVILDNQVDARFREATANGTNYVGFQAPATVAADILWTLPDADAAVSGYALVSNASGTLSWAAAGGGATGGSTDKVFFENDQTVTTSYTLTASKNAVTAGPVTINSAIVVTIPSGASWVVV